ncbi:ABC transporter permease [Pajaroellobacter abortibovis]|uniref:ABC transmembrane type-1 domain-containing protein n=1 Tax=Pajaroellobacter abortibovis TaxID=1882918 RepID=A0A1L6MVR7_9BACT|nr:ABC transporter permease [Pajaroellobacter abortibovis]APR99574.1 hypothetical protein BCY86_01920 [Pajaroellobacter abortibovis]
MPPSESRVRFPLCYKGIGRLARILMHSLGEVFLVIFLLASFVFLAVRLLPGDPAILILGEQASPIALHKLRQQLYLDEPLWLQYIHFFKRFLTLQLGESIRHPGLSTHTRIFAALGPTAALAGLAVLWSTWMGILLSFLSASHWLKGKASWLRTGIVLISSTPLLSFAPLFTYLLTARFRLFPLPGDPEAGGWGLCMAAGFLAVPLAAHLARVGGAVLQQIAKQPFLVVARAKGCSWPRVWLVHALPVALGPFLIVIASQLGALLGGTLVLERLFERPGLGTLILESCIARDLPVLETGVIVAGILFIGVQGIAMALHRMLDPRVRI